MTLGITDYRSIVIKADTANAAIAPIRLSQNDQDGRRIVFELWNGAESVDPSGLNARLLYGVGDGGYATMESVSGADTATWAVDVPQEALSVVGIVRMAVEVASGAQAVCTRIFDAIVEPALIDEDSQEAQDALSDFREAVARLSDFTVPVPVSNGGTGSTVGALAAVGSNISVKSTAIDSTDASTEAANGNGYALFDSGGRLIGVLSAVKITGGKIGTTLYSTRNIGGSTPTNYLRLLVAADGTRTVEVSDPAAWRAGLNITPTNIGALPANGGTISGSLVIDKYNEFINSSNLTSGTAPASNTSGQGIQFRDKTGEQNGILGLVGPRFYSDGTQTMEFNAVRVINGQTKNGGLALGVDASGSPTVNVTDTQPWSKMVGIDGIQVSAGATATVQMKGNAALIVGVRVGTSAYVALADTWASSVTVVHSSGTAPTITTAANSTSISIKNNANVAMVFYVISAKTPLSS